MDPLRLRVLVALTERLATIHPSLGFVHDLLPNAEYPDGKVFRGRATYGENSPLPMVSIIEDPREQQLVSADSSSGNPTTSGPWRLLIQGFVEDDFANPTDPAYRLEADVRRALAQEIRENGPKRNLLGLGPKVVTEIKFGRGIVRPPDEVSSKAYFWLPLTLTLVENNVEPFT